MLKTLKSGIRKLSTDFAGKDISHIKKISIVVFLIYNKILQLELYALFLTKIRYEGLLSKKNRKKFLRKGIKVPKKLQI